eukprot:TRINITY_DN66_c0_g1_i1.p1 TRINITY_DN66_c0_g1~~TRINITY_DN66_c0_g1_i1.p1  ORF type:complete len:120 (+),score=37.92 TRINITY_DN66_c0_g1_i1:61-420(+)
MAESSAQGKQSQQQLQQPDAEAYQPTGSFLLDLILQPGSSTKLVPAINATLVGLLVVLCVLQAKGESNIHFTVLGILAVGLMASVNWFISEFSKVKAQQAADRQAGRGVGSVAADGKED